MTKLITLTHFVWSTHIYFYVLLFLFAYSNNTSELLGYLGGFISSTLMLTGLLLVFRSGLRISELVIPVLMFAGVVFLFIQYFYLSGRADLYWFAIYSAGVAFVQTIRFLFKEKSTTEKFLTFSLLSHLFASFLALGVWFYVHYFTSITEEMLFKIILMTYAGLGIFVEGLQVLASRRVISRHLFSRILTIVMMVIFLITMTSLSVTYIVQDIIQQQ